MQIDFGQSDSDYAKYRVEFAPELLTRLAAMRVGIAGQSILDVGAGTGLLSRHFRAQGCAVVAMDSSERLLRHAGDLVRVLAVTERLPFAAESFNSVTAAQSWHWFDRRLAPREILRVLRPGGTLAAIYQTYIPMPRSVAEASEQLILRYRPGWRHANSTGINGQVLRDMQAAGFNGIESFSFDVCIEFTQETWRGYIRASSPVGASMSPEIIAQFDAQHAQRAGLRN